MYLLRREFREEVKGYSHHFVCFQKRMKNLGECEENLVCDPHFIGTIKALTSLKLGSAQCSSINWNDQKISLLRSQKEEDAVSRTGRTEPSLLRPEDIANQMKHMPFN